MQPRPGVVMSQEPVVYILHDFAVVVQLGDSGGGQSMIPHKYLCFEATIPVVGVMCPQAVTAEV